MIIGINSYSTGGKDTVAKIIQELQPEKSWEVKKFAGKLKTIASLLTGIDVSLFEDQEFKEKLMPLDWVEQWMEGTTKYYKLMKVRDFLQKLGTEAIRDVLHNDTWANALMVDYKIESNWVVTDTRFHNEAQAIRDFGGVVVRINRDGVKPVNAHPSEVALDNFEFDYILENNGSLEDLKRSVTFMLKKFDESRRNI